MAHFKFKEQDSGSLKFKEEDNGSRVTAQEQR
jgi:hypothetical protein